MTDRKEIKIGISACLLGQNVRYDGTNKLHATILEMLGPRVEFVPFCPEVAVGLGIPRPPIQLVRIAGAVRTQGVEDSSLDPTHSLRQYGEQTAKRLGEISGFIFKARSPSCGVNNAKLFEDGILVSETGTGLFAAEIIKANPLLPIAQESELENAVQCQSYLLRVLNYHEIQLTGSVAG